MATVRITAQLQNEVEMRINTLFETRISNAHSKEQEKVKELANKLYNSYIQKHLPHLKDLPEEFTQKTTDVPIKLIGEGDQHYTIETSFNEHVFAPPTSGWTRTRVSICDHAAFLQVKAAKQPKESLINERDTMIEQIKAVMAQCTTLKQLLKAWPQAETLIPTKYIERMNQKTPRNNTTTLPPEVAEDLSAKLLAAKIQASVA